jgi:hypothetical protein
MSEGTAQIKRMKLQEQEGEQKNSTAVYNVRAERVTSRVLPDIGKFVW